LTPAVTSLESRTLLSTVTYHGGPIIPHVQVEALDFGWAANAVEAQQERYLSTAIGDLVSSGYMDVLNQYGAGRGTFDGTTSVGPTLPLEVLYDSSVQSILTTALSQNLLATPSPSQLYMIFVPARVTLPSNGGTTYGYHGHFWYGSSDIRYAVVTTFSGMNAATATATHELAEAVTDPDGNAWWDNVYGDEIGETGSNGYALPTTGFDGYGVSQLWSNAANGPVSPPNNVNWTTLNGWVSQIVTINGRWNSAIFGIGGDHAVYQWNGSYWQDLGGWVSSIAAAEDYWGNIQLFGIGGDHTVWMHQPGTANWISLGNGGWVGQLAVARLGYGNIEVFGVGGDGAVYTSYQSLSGGGGFTSWERIPQAVDISYNSFTHMTISTPALAGSLRVQALGGSGGALDVFITDAYNNLFYCVESPSYSFGGWTALDRELVATDSAFLPNGDLELFGIDAFTHQVVYYVQPLSQGSTSFSGSTLLANWWARSLVVGREADGRVAVFVIGSDYRVGGLVQDTPDDGALPHSSYWQINAWYDLAGYVTQITTLILPDGRLQVIGIGGNNGVWFITQTSPNGGWT
jgi:hypothetical protein